MIPVVSTTTAPPMPRARRRGVKSIRSSACYTAVLRGFLSLITLQFPSGTQGHQLDAFARRPLWEMGLDYDHGTGHGVGHQLLIHENPHRIAKRSTRGRWWRGIS